MSELDPDVYGEYQQSASIDIQGAHVSWVNIPAAERPRIVPVIREQEDHLDKTYRTKLIEKAASIVLGIEFKRPPTPAAVRSLKGEVFALLMATSWGGR